LLLEWSGKTVYAKAMMRRNTLFLAVSLSLLLLFPASGFAEIVRFLNVIDGDSIRVVHLGDAREIRLIGMDAPEFGQEYGTQAKAFTLRFCFQKTLRLEYDREKKDRYGRFLAYVWVGDKMLNEELVRAGLALPLTIKPNIRYYDRIQKAQAEAKRKGSGFWRRGGLKQTPSQWRKKHPRK